VFYHQGITGEQAGALMEQDLVYAEHDVNTLVSVPLTQDQYDAMVSFRFNIGHTGFSTSGTLETLNAGDYGDVPTHMKGWNKEIDDKTGFIKTSKGLTNRRAAEILLWSGTWSPL